MITKKEWIAVYTRTLRQYINKTHEVSTSSCFKCKLLVKHCHTSDRHNSPICTMCLESGHSTQISRNTFTANCSRRYSEPYDSLDSDNQSPIEYHKRAIKMLKELSEDENWFTIAKRNLVDIDNDLRNEANL